jgi:hypothetical protein
MLDSEHESSLLKNPCREAERNDSTMAATSAASNARQIS